ncbi:MAG TPA: hypothetical protein VD902_21465 [Symbiobacteriaceae bacterium]|nr:hypothetical protein [Symbiobacteriaceae bacterium]
MNRLKEYGLNGLLAILVVLSIGLSAWVWFPPGRGDQVGSKEPSVQSTPTSLQGVMPDVFRPERIYVRKANNQIALLPAGSVSYKRVWRGAQDVLIGMRAATVPSLDGDPDPATPSITLVFPTALTIGEWADRWKWTTTGSRSFSLKVDRVTMYLDEAGPVYFTGAMSGPNRLGPMSSDELEMLKELVANIEPELFRPYRQISVKDPTIRIEPGVVVPDITDVPVASLGVRKPDNVEEVARYFPDLSVVRQIEEREARSFSDGLRVLRITSGGQLEFRIVHTLGTAPDRTKALNAANEWVGQNGGWPQEMVLSSFSQQPGRTTMVFDLRMDGVYPVETATGALGVEVTIDRDEAGNARNTVTQYRRYPDLMPHFGQTKRPIISPERAVQNLLARYPSFLLFEDIREIHLAYLVRPPGKAGGGNEWVLEPAWVILVGEQPMYVPAATVSDMLPFPAGMQ